MANQVPEDMTVQNREVFASARVPKERTCLFQAQAMDLADEPISSVLRGGERIQGLRDFATAFRKQTVSRANDVRGLVVVEARAMTQECCDLRGFTGPEEFGLSQSGDGRVGRSGLRLYGHDAEAQFLEEPLFEELCFCIDRKSTRLNSSHDQISYAVFCLKK